MTDAHAALMDRMYRPQRRIYDLTRKHYLLGRDETIDALSPPPGAHVLEICCGTGRNLIRASRLYPQARFYGMDISAVMLDEAREQAARRKSGAPIVFAEGDATDFDAQALFGVPRFERIFISYALSMIPAWRDALAHAFDLLTPEGELHVVDFGDQAGLPLWFRIALARWLARFHVQPRRNLANDFAAQAQARGLAHRHDALYRGYAFHEVAAPRLG
ncbi:class I SAM-dependent methyltransferase [Methylocystis bryophila]|uniref:SAM-dependent methyltransferase n=1 Tax=Methylocystis bryophila TaxID=655015 RepID=A0A1W6MY83_9HYPH|nr:class I SAM-dependent methyltransferase [Methylocystis bryophila]ARN82552.1 SAM-dependent methyltransferase [Methylocystis bryophila]BDV38762.1 O-methyltransferase [Methylocystis bryophila]